MSKFIDFAERLVWHRSAAGLSQRELAELSGVSLPQITRYESGKSAPRLAAVMKIAKALKVDVDAFTGSRSEAGLQKLVLEMSDSPADEVSVVIPHELIEFVEKTARDLSISTDDAFALILANAVKNWTIRSGKPWTEEDEARLFKDIDLPHKE
ncbi:helix-turn-helix transcriptional regulator [Pseudomonas denitrificans (nom. rej.)]|nr:helix-turn-helix transcriptional regulator [Pseudomonas denitrificans (nom. rej.)]